MGDPESTSRTRSAYSQNKTSYPTGSKGIVKVVSKNAHISRNILQKLPSEVKEWEQNISLLVARRPHTQVILYIFIR